MKKVILFLLFTVIAFAASAQEPTWKNITLTKDTAIVYQKSILGIAEPHAWTWSVLCAGIGVGESAYAEIQVADTLSNLLTSNKYFMRYPNMDTAILVTDKCKAFDDFILPWKYIRMYIHVTGTITLTRTKFTIKQK